MRAFIVLVSMCLAFRAFAAGDIKFSFNNEEITKIVEVYSKASGQKFVMDPSVRGKATILLPNPVSVEEAFNQLSTALAVNGFAIAKQDDTMVIMSARNIQRNLVETTNDVPALKPERMVTYIMTLKYVSAEDINRSLRIIPSRDGELSVFSHNNQIIVTDWASNLQRVAALMKELDKPADAGAIKVVSAARKERDEWAAKHPPGPMQMHEAHRKEEPKPPKFNADEIKTTK
jgi:type II secretory pathway component GspD/PulD (secretin)